MTVRAAKAVDIPAIVNLLQVAYLRTPYARSGVAQIDVAETKRLLVASIQRHGHNKIGGTWLCVSEHDGVLTGLIFGTANRIYSIGNKLQVTDLFFITTPDAKPTDAIALAKSLILWAERCPDVIEINVGTTMIAADDPAKAGLIWQRLGLQHFGNLYRGEIERAQQCLAS